LVLTDVYQRSAHVLLRQGEVNRDGYHEYGYAED
jgi:hypothetical protein